MSTIKFTKIRDVKTPSRSNPTDAGIDFFVPKFTEQFKQDLLNKNPFLKENIPIYNEHFDTSSGLNKSFYLLPNERVLIPSGIKCKMERPRTAFINEVHINDYNKALIAANKSGIASKLGLIVGASIVDFSYQGEIHINVINTSNEAVNIYEDMKIIQFIETPVIISDIVIIDTEEKLYGGVTTDRGEKGFGSTDNK
jgi:dUTPase